MQFHSLTQISKYLHFLYTVFSAATYMTGTKARYSTLKTAVQKKQQEISIAHEIMDLNHKAIFNGYRACMMSSHITTECHTTNYKVITRI